MEGYTALVRSLNDELMVELMRKVGGKLFKGEAPKYYQDVIKSEISLSKTSSILSMNMSTN